MLEYEVESIDQTKKLAKIIANRVKIGNVVLLRGTLGAGKTYFTKCLINILLNKNNSEEIDVTSPTFNILKEYKAKKCPIYHFDLYRLKDKNELHELDIESCFEKGISIIEWPEIAEDIIYNIAVDIKIEILKNDKRLFKIKFF